MQTVVLYDATCETSGHVARAVARALTPFGPVRLLSEPFQEQRDALLEADLIVVGAPTHGHLEQTHRLQRLLDRLPPGSLQGKLAVAFDTWRPGAKWMMGSTANGLSLRLRRKGARVISPPTSFMASDRAGTILQGELRRAGAWATTFSGRALDTRPSSF
ncbi:MAG: hypothetical protein P8Y02_12955 [Deinococcales bacterium]